MSFLLESDRNRAAQMRSIVNDMNDRGRYTYLEYAETRTRIVRARIVGGVLQFRELSTGKWIPNPGNFQIEVS